MTALCGGGTSAPIVSVPATQLWGVSALVNLLTDGGWSWIQEAIALVGAVNFDLPTFCATDPPAQPTFTLAEIQALLTFQPSTDFDSGLSKLNDLVQNLAWYQLCECTSGPQPTPPAPQSSPISTNTPGQSGNCGTISNGSIVFPAAGDIINIVGNFKLANGSNNSSRVGVAIPAGLTNVSISVQCLDAPNGTEPPHGSGLNNDFNWAFEDNSHTLKGNGLIANVSPGFNKSATATPTAGATMFYLWGGVDSIDGLDHHVSATVNFNCSATSGDGTTGCCPPDPSLLSLLQVINNAVTLIQRQTAPFGYVTGATHSGLSGSGTISVSDLLGIKVNPTTIPGYSGLVSGDPDTLWLDSWINWGNADGWTERQFLRSAPFLSLPSLAGQFTQVGYTLAPGLVVDITELVREP